MFNKSLTISLCVFFILMIFTSYIKNKTRNIEKNIKILNKQISILNKELNVAEIDFVYLSSPENINEKILNFDKKKYSSFDYSRLFLSTDEFLRYSSNESKNLQKND